MSDMPDEDELSLAEELFLDFVDPEELPAESMRAAIANWPICSDFFIATLHRYVAGDLDPADDGDALLFLLHLFGQMREARAYRPLLELLTQPIETLESLLGDSLDATLAQILAGVFDGDPGPLEEIILDPGVHEYARWPVLDAYGGLAHLRQIDRERAERILFDFGEMDLPPEDGAWIGWLHACAAIASPNLLSYARQMVTDGKAAPHGIGASDFEADISAWRDDPEGELKWLRPLDDVIDEMSRWHGFSEAGIAERRKAEHLGGSIGRETHVNPHRDIGRNDPCPCGSGKKFKKCHGA